jgi:hypothetical protein
MSQVRSLPRPPPDLRRCRASIDKAVDRRRCGRDLHRRRVSYYDCLVEVHRSSRKHGIADEDVLHAARGFLVAYPLQDGDQDGPRRELRLGPDRAGNLLETVVLLLDDGDELVIHAMRMRPKYRGLLP